MSKLKVFLILASMLTNEKKSIEFECFSSFELDFRLKDSVKTNSVNYTGSGAMVYRNGDTTIVFNRMASFGYVFYSDSLANDCISKNNFPTNCQFDFDYFESRNDLSDFIMTADENQINSNLFQRYKLSSLSDSIIRIIYEGLIQPELNLKSQATIEDFLILFWENYSNQHQLIWELEDGFGYYNLYHHPKLINPHHRSGYKFDVLCIVESIIMSEPYEVLLQKAKWYSSPKLRWG